MFLVVLVDKQQLNVASRIIVSKQIEIKINFEMQWKMLFVWYETHMKKNLRKQTNLKF